MSMSPSPKLDRKPQRPLRLWPGAVAIVLQWLIWLVVPVFSPEARVTGLLVSFMGGGVLVSIWWLFFSRASWLERLGAIALMAAGVAAVRNFLDGSLSSAGEGILFFIYVVPALCLALVTGAAVGRRLGPGPRRAVLAAAILAGCGFFACLRTEGVTGDFRSQFAWRWTRTSEQKLLAVSPADAAGPQPAPAAERIPNPPSSPVAATPTSLPPPPPAEWPGFRGPHRDAVVSNLRIGTDWASSPPALLWRRSVGPGWSSFAAGGGLVYTQEQRGPDEVVACYDLAAGKPIWSHRDAARFWESNAGAGPRGTPSLSGGRVYTLGATGILNALDARTGALVWTRNAATDAGIKVPGWGFSSSPLVLDDEIVVALSGRLAAYSPSGGAPRWLGPDGGESYSSPQLLTIGGLEQILFLSKSGLAAFSPADGVTLWKHRWEGFASLQPALAADGAVLVATSGETAGLGVRHLSIARGASEWSVREDWTSSGLKPYFNDFVIYKGYAYGFDGGILSCIDLQDGARKWKGGRYGYGQMVLLSEQGLLLVVTEEGELALVSATPERFTELAKLPALEGKTWNHPIVANGILLARNGEEMAAWRLPQQM